MNKALEEFKELRTVYSGRIDEALQGNDDKALAEAKAEYKKILEKYMNVACQVLSLHTNYPFRVAKKTNKGMILRSEKDVLKDTESIRDSLNFINLSELEVSDIKNALDVVEDYFNKIISDKEVGKVDRTKFNFRIIFGAVITPFFVVLMSLISGLMINKFLSEYQFVSSLKEFVNLAKKSADSGVPLLVLVIVNMGLAGLYSYIYASKARDSDLNKKQVMLIPITIINLLILLGPLHIVISYLFNPIFDTATLSLMIKLSDLFLLILGLLVLVIGLAGSNYDAGDFRSVMGIGHILMMVFVIFSFLLPPAFKVVSDYVNLSVITDNQIFKVFINFKYLKLIITLVYLVYLLISINKHVFIDEKYEQVYRIICIIASVLIVVGSILLII